MAKFTAQYQLNPSVLVSFAAESAEEVLSTLQTLFGPRETTEPAPAPGATTTPKRPRGRPRKTVVGVISPAGAAKIAEEPALPVSEEPAARAYTLAEISDLIRDFARRPGVGVPGVTKLIQSFNAKQVKDIPADQYGAVVDRIKALSL